MSGILDGDYYVLAIKGDSGGAFFMSYDEGKALDRFLANRDEMDPADRVATTIFRELTGRAVRFAVDTLESLANSTPEIRQKMDEINATLKARDITGDG